MIPEQVLTNQISAVLDEAFAGVEKALPVHEELWPDILLDVIRPLIRNMRDVRRYGLAVRSAMDALDGQVAPRMYVHWRLCAFSCQTFFIYCPEAGMRLRLAQVSSCLNR